MIEDQSSPLNPPADHPTLLEAIQSLRDSEKDLTKELQAIRPLVQRANKTARRAKIVAIVGVIVGATGLVVGAFGYQAQVEANQSVADARTAACVQSNWQLLKVYVKQINGVEAIFADPDNPTPREREFLDAYAKATAPEYRDCSPEGIEEFLNNPPPDPALNL